MKLEDIRQLNIHHFSQGEPLGQNAAFLKRLHTRIERLRHEILFDPSVLVERDSLPERLAYLRNRVIYELYEQDRDLIQKHVEQNYVDIVALTYLSWLLGAMTAGFGYFLPKFQLLQVGILINVTVIGLLTRVCRRSQSSYKEVIDELEKSYLKLFLYSSVIKLESECLICLDSIKPEEKTLGHLALGRAPHIMHPQCFNQYIDHSRCHTDNSTVFYKCPCCQIAVTPMSITAS